MAQKDQLESVIACSARFLL